MTSFTHLVDVDCPAERGREEEENPRLPELEAQEPTMATIAGHGGVVPDTGDDPSTECAENRDDLRRRRRRRRFRIERSSLFVSVREWFSGEPAAFPSTRV